MSGMETRDDAGYVPFGGGLLLQTADFFTPIVDDPYRFGQIAAAKVNARSPSIPSCGRSWPADSQRSRRPALASAAATRYRTKSRSTVSPSQGGSRKRES